jgi:dihydrolipoamide dehydrogenase
VDAFGLSVGEVGFDFAKVMERSRGVAGQMAKGIEFLFRKNKVDYLVGRAQVAAPGMVELTEGEHKGRFLRGRQILLATGCKPRRLPDVPVDGERVMTSREALVPRARPPASLVIIGAGAIGVEFAYFYSAFGTKVTLVELMPQLVPVEDEEVGRGLQRAFEKSGITVHVGTKVEGIAVAPDRVTMKLVPAVGGAVATVEAESLLIAVGVVPNLDGAVSPKVRLELERGYLKVDDRYETSVKGIYAAGDIIGPPWLAHVATFEAIQAVNAMFGHAHQGRVKVFPGCTYCQPQIASTGLTEKACKEKGLAYKVGKFPFAASGKAVAAGDAEGFVKVITDAATGEILGAHILGNEAPELIAEYVLAMNLEGTVEEIHHSIHAHPTLSEALAEAAAATSGEAIHI